MFFSKISPLLRFGIKGLNSKNNFLFGVKTTGVRHLSSSGIWFNMDQKFTASQKAVTGLREEPDNDTKLKLYALFKQATQGQCNTAKPGALDFVGRAKWTAWTALGDMSTEKAKKEYVALVKELTEDEVEVSDQISETDASLAHGLKVETRDGIRTIILNRPEKKNALTYEMYRSLINTFNEAAKDNQVKFLVIRGSGDYFCSGNDLSNFTKGAAGGDIKQLSQDASHLLRDFIGAFIDFPKPLVIVVNGPAVGIAVTTLGLADIVYAKDTATFHTPFSALGQSPEGCSSYTFPKLMGPAQANDILMLNKRLNAQEAFERHLVTAVFPASEFDSLVEQRLNEMAKLPHLSLQYAKQLSRNPEKEVLQRVNREECERLIERWTSEDCIRAISQFFQRKAKM